MLRLPLPVLLGAAWAISLGGVWWGTQWATEHKARAECAEQNAAQLAADIAAATSAWSNTQADITRQADRAAQRIAQDLEAARQQAARIHQELTDYATNNPLPAGCDADPGRVWRFNQARQPSDAPAFESVLRPGPSDVQR